MINLSATSPAICHVVLAAITETFHETKQQAIITTLLAAIIGTFNKTKRQAITAPVLLQPSSEPWTNQARSHHCTCPCSRHRNLGQTKRGAKNPPMHIPVTCWWPSFEQLQQQVQRDWRATKKYQAGSLPGVKVKEQGQQKTYTTKSDIERVCGENLHRFWGSYKYLADKYLADKYLADKFLLWLINFRFGW
jgi:hypothetical protein